MTLPYLADQHPGLADRIGRGSYGGMSAVQYDEKTKLTIGKYCSFGYNVEILLGGNHQKGWATTFPFDAHFDDPSLPDSQTSRGDITIGNDVWIGARAMILSGTTIGDGAIIGAHALVTGCVPPYAIYAGNPARCVGWRFGPEDDSMALAARMSMRGIKWWDWPEERIKKALPFMLQDDIWKFINAVYQGKV